MTAMMDVKAVRGFRSNRDGSAIVVVEGTLGGMTATAGLPMPHLRKGESRHSPGGFEWGYQGSGPAELARAILVRLFPHDELMRDPRVYQTFKREVIAALERDSPWILTRHGIEAWRRDFDTRPARGAFA